MLDNFRQKFFANYMTRLSHIYNDTLDEEKKLLFEKLKAQRELKKGSKFTILEIGAGSGCNLKYYPSNCSVIIVDPNPYFEPHVRQALEKCPVEGLQFEGCHVAYGEDMSFIQDESIDAVVTTAVGCSLNNVQQVYKEIQRVLIQGGKYYYLEHILGRPGTWPYYKQKAMASIPIWKFVNCNCNIDRDLDYQITLAGFSNIDQRNFEMDTSPYLGFHFISPHVTGVAIK